MYIYLGLFDTIHALVDDLVKQLIDRTRFSQHRSIDWLYSYYLNLFDTIHAFIAGLV